MTEPKDNKPSTLQDSTVKNVEAIKQKGKESQTESEQTECPICKSKFVTHRKFNEHFNSVHNTTKFIKNKKKPLVDPLKLEQIEQTCNKIRKSKPGFELLELRNFIQPSPDEINTKLNKIIKDIKYAMSNVCYNYDVYPFGSSVTGLAFYDSDADFYIHTNNKMDSIQNLKRLKTELWVSRKFSKIVTIFAAKIPLLKCFHIETKSYVDINNANGLACCNSNFIRYIMNFDFRIYPLTVVIKYWAKCHNLSGTGRISNYCLTIMIIFYLQTMQHPILPTIFMCQQHVPAYCIGSWNLAFNAKAPNLSQNQSSIPQLIIGFFNYYNTFDFENDVICTLFGRIYKKSDFLTIDVVPKEFDRMIKHIKTTNDKLNVNNPMCVQDPFELNRNISNFKIKLLNLIKSYFKCAVNIMNECGVDGSPLSTLLVRMFTEKPFQDDPRVECFARTFPIFPLPTIKDYIVKKSTTTSEESDTFKEMEKLWCTKVPEILIEIFTNIFFIKLTIINTYNSTNTASAVASGESSTQPSTIIQYYDMYAEFDVWTDRKKCLVTDDSLIDEEIKNSNILLTKKRKTNLKCILKIVSKNFNYVSLQFNESEIIQESGTRSLFYCIKKNVRFYIKPYFQKFYKNFT